MSEPMRIGIVGCGNISAIYFKNLTSIWDWVSVEACSDLIEEKAREKEKEFGVRACTTEDILGDTNIDIVLNLTTPPFHTKINCAALQAGKHVYCEKPMALNRDDAKKTVALAEDKGLLVGCAPDTFLGAGIQTCRKLIDEGIIGTPVSAMAFMTCHGHESWHPDPEFYYQAGGGPMLDMGPYYLTALLNCMGPMDAVCGFTGKAFTRRTITSEYKYGQKIEVNVPTHQAGTVRFASGALATVVMSFDVWKSTVPRIEVHGTTGSLVVPDPNTFGGEVTLFREGDREGQRIPLFSHPYAENSRGLGVADLALAAQNGASPRASGARAAHVLDAMCAFEESSDSGKAIDLTTSCDQPPALPTGLRAGQRWA